MQRIDRSTALCGGARFDNSAPALRGGARCLCCAACVLLASGCYFAELGQRELALVNEQRPLPDAIARERNARRRALLELVPALRSFARNTLQLPVGHSYSGYYASEDQGILYVLVASERTRFVPYTWWFPIVGEVSYRSYVRESEARAAARALEDD